MDAFLARGALCLYMMFKVYLVFHLDSRKICLPIVICLTFELFFSSRRYTDEDQILYMYAMKTLDKMKLNSCLERMKLCDFSSCFWFFCFLQCIYMI